MSNTKLHTKLLSLVGKTINVTRWSNPELRDGKLVYVMPDSILIATGQENLIVEFSDLKTFDLKSS